jgi:hypothetical protein
MKEILLSLWHSFTMFVRKSVLVLWWAGLWLFKLMIAAGGFSTMIRNANEVLRDLIVLAARCSANCR